MRSFLRLPNRRAGRDAPEVKSSESLPSTGFSSCLGEAITEIGGNPLLDHLAQETRERCSDSDQNPQKRGEHEASNGDCLQGDGHGMGLIKMEFDLVDMGNQLDSVNDHCGKKEGNNR